MPCWLISSDDYEIGRLAARHLIEAGTRVLACVGSPFPNLQERIRGFREEANNLGVTVPSSRVPSSENIPAESSRAITFYLMELDPRPDGIFYFNDQYALAGLRQLHDLGIDVPGEVKLVGCDNIEATWHCRPTLTTIRQDPVELGHQAFQLLSEMLEASTADRLSSRHSASRWSWWRGSPPAGRDGNAGRERRALQEFGGAGAFASPRRPACQSSPSSCTVLPVHAFQRDS